MQHKDIPDAQLHEVKGAATASAGQILTATGAGIATFQTPLFTKARVGFWDYNDTATSSTPIALTAANTEYQLTNNGTGVYTNTAYGLPGVTNIYNTATNYFNFSSLKIGDTVDIRVECEITTTSTSNELDLLMELGIGTSPYKLVIDRQYFKSASVKKVVAMASIYIGNNDTKNGLARFIVKNDSTGSSIKVSGWYIRVITNG